MTEKSTAFVANLFDAMLLNVLVRRRELLLGSRDTLFGFLPVYFTGRKRDGKRNRGDEQVYG